MIVLHAWLFFPGRQAIRSFLRFDSGSISSPKQPQVSVLKSHTLYVTNSTMYCCLMLSNKIDIHIVTLHMFMAQHSLLKSAVKSPFDPFTKKSLQDSIQYIYL